MQALTAIGVPKTAYGQTPKFTGLTMSTEERSPMVIPNGYGAFG
jgi:hypothetical protein